MLKPQASCGFDASWFSLQHLHIGVPSEGITHQDYRVAGVFKAHVGQCACTFPCNDGILQYV